MKKNFGFTLAEVLITLGIIGVVAALTAPALVTNSGQAKIGPSLAKFVNTFETACEQMLQEEEVSRLSNALKSGKASVETVDDVYLPHNTRTELMEALSKYMIMSEYSGELKVNKPDGTNLITTNGTNYKAYMLKDGSTMAVRPAYDWGANGLYKGELVEIYYDINGPAGNNKLAKEVFVFGVDDGGYILPFGSAAHKELTKGRSMDIANGNRTCNPKASGGSGDNCYANASACTGAIADNGWKADY